MSNKINLQHDNRQQGPPKRSGESDSLNAPKRSIIATGANAAHITFDSYDGTNLREACEASNSSGEAELPNALKRSILASGEFASTTHSARSKKMNVGDVSNGVPNALAIAWNDHHTPTPAAHSKSITSGENPNSNEDDTISHHQPFKDCLAEAYQGVHFCGTFPQSKWNAIENKHETWNDRKNRAAKATIDFITHELSSGGITRSNNMQYHDDSDSSDDSYPRRINSSNQTSSKNLSTNEKKVILALPNCLPLDQGFHVKGNNNNAICFCPCGNAVQPWREKHNVHVDEDDVCIGRWSNALTPNTLSMHLAQKGGQATRVFCMLHYSTAEYLRRLHSEDK